MVNINQQSVRMRDSGLNTESDSLKPTKMLEVILGDCGLIVWIFIFYHYGYLMSIYLVFYIGEEGECTQYLLAKDGVMVHGKDNTVPRFVGNGIFLAQSSRVDVAISCPGSPSGFAKYEIWHTIQSNRDPSGFEKVVIAFIEVTGTATAPEITLTPFKPIRPNYLENLMPGQYAGNLEYQQYEHCEGRGPNTRCNTLSYLKDLEISGATIKNQKFQGETSYITEMDIDKVHIWEITAEPTSPNVHPLHVSYLPQVPFEYQLNV